MSGDDEALGYLFAEVKRRGALAANTYPFTVDDTGLRKKDDVDASLYELLLFLGLEQSAFRSDKKWVRATSLLEGVAKHALLSYWGPRTSCLRFGWPSEDGRPKSFPDAIGWLAGRLGLSEGKANPHPKQKDGGLDVIAWSAFDDTKGSFAVLLGQVTVGLNDLASKGQDIPVHQWVGWIEFGVPPITALILPFVLSVSDDLWGDLQYRANVVLDRLRICQLVEPGIAATLCASEQARTFLEREREALVLA